MRILSVKYLQRDKKSGIYSYRRRVPKELTERMPQGEIFERLGRSDEEVLRNWTLVHQRIEHQLELARSGLTGLSEADRKERLVAMLQEYGADPHGPGRDENEKTWREVKADRIVDQYQNPVTGQYDDLPDDKRSIASAFTGGVSKEAVEPTVADAFIFYLKEKALPVPEQRKKQIQRFGRAEIRLIGILQGDRKLSEVTRKNARAWRDMRVAAGVSPTTIRREKNDISAVISLAISELDTKAENLFSGLQIVGASAGGREDRKPLPELVIEGMYEALSDHPELLMIWTLLDFTGARPGEVRMLRVDEFRLDADVPHIAIETREGRTLKTQWSTREVPLVGAALSEALKLVDGAEHREIAFPNYAGTGGMDRMSAALNGRIRKLTADPKHVAYSLRHNMKDRMREAEVFPETAKAIEGHAYSAGQDASYGEGVGLRKKAEALNNALSGYRVPM